MVAKTKAAAKAEPQLESQLEPQLELAKESDLSKEKGSTARKAASKTKQTSASSKSASSKPTSSKTASSKAAKKTADKKTSSQKSQVAKASSKSAQKTAQKTADPSKQSIQTSLAVEEAPLNPTDPAQPINFVATDHMSGDIWQPNSAIPTLDEATYASQKAQAEAQRRALEVASLNLENINSLHQLERQSIDIAISTQMNETRNAQLTGAEIDYQTQQAVNGEKSQHLKQASAKHEAAIRETGYADQLIALKDQNFELEIQQAQNVFAEKAARYRAQLTGE